jgi:glycosyltransferase involved in cell wall biosynthesis
MRILIVTHAPLTTEFGASQLAINLSEALRQQGHDVTLWSPSPLAENVRWWRTIPAMRGRLNQFLRTQDAFDVIECPATLVTRLAARSSRVLVRSTQPDLRYLYSGLSLSSVRDVRSLGRVPLDYLHTLYHALRVIRGWQLAQSIICLGNLELSWMRRQFPSWHPKLKSYVAALSNSDQLALSEVRRTRAPRTLSQCRFLWIGRWTAHKGTDLLLQFIERWTAHRPQDSFTIAGCGPDAERDCPVELVRSGVIEIIPTYRRSDLGAILAEHDIGLFTSKVEGWGLSLNEMLEAGLPVFATQAGGTEDLLTFVGERLQTFPPTMESILGALGADVLFDNYYREFSWKKIAERYAECISEELSLGSNETPLPLHKQSARSAV